MKTEQELMAQWAAEDAERETARMADVEEARANAAAAAEAAARAKLSGPKDAVPVIEHAMMTGKTAAIPYSRPDGTAWLASNSRAKLRAELSADDCETLTRLFAGVRAAANNAYYTVLRERFYAISGIRVHYQTIASVPLERWESVFKSINAGKLPKKPAWNRVQLAVGSMLKAMKTPTKNGKMQSSNE